MSTRAGAAARRQELLLPYRHVDTHFFDGGWTASQGTGRIEVTDPATGAVWGSVPAGTSQDVDTAVRAAHHALHSSPWKNTTPSERAALLLRIAHQIENRAGELSLTNTLENGSPGPQTGGGAPPAPVAWRV